MPYGGLYQYTLVLVKSKYSVVKSIIYRVNCSAFVLMPLIMKETDIEWFETTDRVNITINLPRGSKKNVEVFSTSRYLKVSFPPYLCEVFLNGCVDSDKSIARIGDEIVTCELLKKYCGLWGVLSNPASCNEEFRKHQRNEALSEAHSQAKTSHTKKYEERSERASTAVKRQIELDNNERERISTLKSAECQRITKEIEEWKIEAAEKVQINKTKRNQELLTSVIHKGKKFPSVLDEIPPLRENGHIIVNFTPRAFPTAARESQLLEEQKWLEKQTAARRSIELDCSDLSAEEKNPQWLKDKGDDLYSKRDFHSAVNAYSLAIRICPTMYSLYCNRAACHLQLRNLHKAIEDSSRALELLTPPVKLNAAARLKCHVRRGTAFCQLELYIEGLKDYDAALKIDPENKDLKADAEKIRLILQSSE